MVKAGRETGKHRFLGAVGELPFSHRLNVFIRDNWKRIATVVACIFVVIVMILGYRFYNAKLEAEASGLVSKAIGNYKQNQTSTSQFESIRDKYSGTNGARLAHLYIGHILYQKGELEKAEYAFEELVKDTNTPTNVRAEANLGLVYSLVKNGKCEKAQRAIEKRDEKGSIQEQQGLLAVARCFELKGNKVKAIEKYQEFAGKYPQSPFLTSNIKSKISNTVKK